MPAKRFEFAASIDRTGGIISNEGDEVMLSAAWSPEELVLAGLGRCTLASLRYHARRAGLDLVGSASARGAVTKRERDGRYAFVELDVDLDVEIDPKPEDLAELLAKTERDCFISASLTPPTRFGWRVNGEQVPQ